MHLMFGILCTQPQIVLVVSSVDSTLVV